MAASCPEKVETCPVESLIPYELNNKAHGSAEIDRLANSINEFGYTYPILVDENNVILAGHKRLLASQKLGLSSVPVLRKTGLTETQKKAYRIIDNKTSEESDWDINNLKLELATLEEMDFDIEQFVVNDFEVEAEDNEPVPDDKFVRPENVETKIKRGDLIEIGEHRLLCGDSTSDEDVVKLLNGEAPDLMVTDPPYGVNYDPEWRSEYDGNKGKRACGKVTNDDQFDWEKVFRLFNAQILYVWHAAIFAVEVGATLQKCGYKLAYQIIWNKPIFVFGRGDYHWKHEPCWYAVRGGATHNYQGDRKQSTVWDIDNNSAFSKEKEERTGHGTQKPLECMARPIRNNSKEGQLVVDPFLGSGTTLIAAARLNRRCYGMEIEPTYCQIIIDRYYKQCAALNIDFDCRVNGEPHHG